MKSLRTLTAGERRRITDGDPADLDVVELLARREWDRLEFTRRAGLLVVRRDGACPARPWLLESDYLDQRRHATLEEAVRELADNLGR